jgi:hypothetical protein
MEGYRKYNKEFNVTGTCYKCGTDNVDLYEYRPGYMICKVNQCWEEEKERDSGRHIRLNRNLEAYRQIIGHSTL